MAGFVRTVIVAVVLLVVCCHTLGLSILDDISIVKDLHLLYPGGTAISRNDFHVLPNKNLVIMRAGPAYYHDSSSKLGSLYVLFEVNNFQMKNYSITSSSMNMRKRHSIWFVHNNSIWLLQRAFELSDSMELQRISLEDNVFEYNYISAVIDFDINIYGVGAGKLFISEEVDRGTIYVIDLATAHYFQHHLSSDPGRFYVLTALIVLQEKYLAVFHSVQEDIIVVIYEILERSLEKRDERRIATVESPFLVTYQPNQNSVLVHLTTSISSHYVTELSYDGSNITLKNVVEYQMDVGSAIFYLQRFGNELIVVNSKVHSVFNRHTGALVSRSILACYHPVLLSSSEYLCVAENTVIYKIIGRSSNEFFNYKRSITYDGIRWQGLIEGFPFLYNSQDLLAIDLSQPKFRVSMIPLVIKPTIMESHENKLYWVQENKAFELDVNRNQTTINELCNIPQNITGFLYSKTMSDLQLIYTTDHGVVRQRANGACDILPMSCEETLRRSNWRYIRTPDSLISLAGDQICAFSPLDDIKPSHPTKILLNFHLEYLFTTGNYSAIWLQDPKHDTYLVTIPSNMIYTLLEKQYKRYGTLIHRNDGSGFILETKSELCRENYALLVASLKESYVRLLINLQGGKKFTVISENLVSSGKDVLRITNLGNREFLVVNYNQSSIETFLIEHTTRRPSSDLSRNWKIAIVGMCAALCAVIILVFIVISLKCRAQPQHYMGIKEEELAEMLMQYSEERSEHSERTEQPHLKKRKKKRRNRMAHGTVKFNFMIPFDQLRIEKCISEGAGGVVFKGLWKTTNTKVAIKKMKLNTELATIAKEVAILNDLRHPNIVLFCGISYDSKTYYIISELMERGSLEALLYSQTRKQLTFAEKMKIVSGISQGMCYLHSKDPMVIHRDLKPPNVLVDNDLNPKICDFGLSKFIINTNMTANTIGTQEYISPEILSASEKYSEKVDVYSFGILMHELFFTVKPYQAIAPDRQPRLSIFESAYSFGKKVLEGLRPEIPFSINDINAMEEWYNRCNAPDTPFNYSYMRMYFDLMVSCWNTDADLRPSFNMICETIERVMHQA